MNQLRNLVLVGFALSLAAACSNDSDSESGNAGAGGTGATAGAGGSDAGSGGTATGASGGAGGSPGGGAGAEGGSAGSGGSATSCAVTPPTTWSAPDFASNAAEALALRTQLQTLTGATTMNGAETGAVSNLTAADLTTAYEAGTVSLADVAATPIDTLMTDAFGEFIDAVDAGTQDLVDAGNWTPGTEGGIWGTTPRTFNEGGLEVRQLVDKALFGGGALYSYALGLTAGTITPETADALAAAFGTNPDLNPGTNNDPVEANKNVHSANYAYQMGFYAAAKESLIAVKAYAGDSECTAERDAALVSFFRIWEESMLARFVHYANQTATGVATAASDDELNSALHLFAEGAGLALGFYGLEGPATGPLSTTPRIITDAQIVSALDSLGLDVTQDLGSATVGNWVADSVGLEDAVNDAEAVIVDVYDWSTTELASYVTPTAG